MMKFDTFNYSDIGNRECNEDSISLSVDERCILAVVADGLGGYSSGEIASKYVISSIFDGVNSDNSNTDYFLSRIVDINSNIRLMQKEHGRMMSTIALLWIDGKNENAISINIGDTRIYQFRDDEILFQSVDHSVAQMAVLAGEISKKDIRSYPRRNELIRAIGASEIVKSEVTELDVKCGDSFLLCSDGFWEIVTEEMMIEALATSKNAKEWLSKMISVVKNDKSTRKDNNSAIAITIME